MREREFHFGKARDVNTRYSIKNKDGCWQVWDLLEDEAMAAFGSYHAAETCMGACELARRRAAVEFRPAKPRTRHRVNDRVDQGSFRVEAAW